MFFSNLEEKYPTALFVKSGDIIGWVDVNNVDFLINEEINKSGVSGTWLHDAVDKAVKRYSQDYGTHIITGEIVGDNIPVRRLTSNNSEQLNLLWHNAEVCIEEVSENKDIINGVAAHWYKIHINMDDETGKMNELRGWVFGNFIEIEDFLYVHETKKPDTHYGM
ncbi:MAG: hypothetical protein FWD47_05720 [Treponema sp.]|nr:hypothetical protein [Treponema sp.]